MYEDNERFSWTNLFIKIIIIIIFVLFTIWLLSLSTKNVVKPMSDSINVLTDNIFSSNVDKMKEVGKDYFTTERLPKKVGETKKISLEEMYKENLILEVKDKNGNACSAKDSYVAVEKMETEYQMKVYLECGEEHNFIKTIMGCYNYCDTDICEKKETPETKDLEYQYSKTTGGYWTNYGSWTEWSKNAVSKTNYRDVDTKTVKETYTYDKTVTDSQYVDDAICPIVDGYNLTSMKDGKCIYSKTVVTTASPLACPSKSGDYDLVSQDGFTCKYSKGSTVTVNPETCPSTTSDGYELVNQDGFTCNYKKSTSTNVTPLACASTTSDGYELVSQDGLTCNYKKNDTETIGATQVASGGGSHQECYQVPVGVKTVTPCSGCGVQVITIYETQCNTVKDPVTYSWTCPSGYKLSGQTCSRTVTLTKTTTSSCPSGSQKSGNGCVKTTVSTKTTTVGCPEGSQKSGNTCVKGSTSTKTVEASCPSGFEKRGEYCAKNVTSTVNKDSICVGDQKMHDGKCYIETSRVETVTDVRKVTYYRYRLREYKGGSTDYKWSTSNKDASLLNAGYKLTGKTREVGGK